MKMRGLFIGRFQPVHKGHIFAISYALNSVDELVIGIGSAQYNYEFENPFTAGERIEMLRLALKEEGLDLARVCIVPIPDLHQHKLWVEWVETLVPKFDVVFSNNPLVIMLFEARGYRVLRPRLIEREKYSGTEFRRRVAEGGNWKELVPNSVAEFLEKIGGIERIKLLSAKT